MTITRFDPFRDLSRFFGDVYLRDEELTSRGNWVPPVDIYETAGHDLVIKAELPDMNREDVEVTVENNTLTLRGEQGPAGRRQGRAVPPRRASLRGFRPFVHAAEHGGRDEGQRRVQERRAHGEAAVPRGSQAAHDQRRSGGVIRSRRAGVGLAAHRHNLAPPRCVRLSSMTDTVDLTGSEERRIRAGRSSEGASHRKSISLR